MIALLDDIDLSGFTVQFKDHEQVGGGTSSDWSDREPLDGFVTRLKSLGATGAILQVLGTVLTFNENANNIRRVIIEQHVINNSVGIRILSLRISNE